MEETDKLNIDSIIARLLEGTFDFDFWFIFDTTPTASSPNTDDSLGNQFRLRIVED